MVQSKLITAQQLVRALQPLPWPSADCQEAEHCCGGQTDAQSLRAWRTSPACCPCSITETWRGSDMGRPCDRCDGAPAVFEEFFGNVSSNILAVGGWCQLATHACVSQSDNIWATGTALELFEAGHVVRWPQLRLMCAVSGTCGSTGCIGLRHCAWTVRHQAEPRPSALQLTRQTTSCGA